MYVRTRHVSPPWKLKGPLHYRPSVRPSVYEWMVFTGNAATRWQTHVGLERARAMPTLIIALTSSDLRTQPTNHWTENSLQHHWIFQVMDTVQMFFRAVPKALAMLQNVFLLKKRSWGVSGHLAWMLDVGLNILFRQSGRFEWFSFDFFEKLKCFQSFVEHVWTALSTNPKTSGKASRREWDLVVWSG